MLGPMMYGCEIAAKLLLLQHISTLAFGGLLWRELATAKEMCECTAKLLLRKERVAMNASDDSKVVVADRSDNRAIWVRPTLRRLAANKAEYRDPLRQ